MNENIIPVNNEALSRALIAVVGPETAAVIVKSYQELDKAMADGYKAGFEAAQEASNKQANECAAQEKFLYSEAHREGYNEGFAAADLSGHGQSSYDKGFNAGSDLSEEKFQMSFDDGYAEGVQDARSDPEEADSYLAHLCSLDMAEVDDYDHQADEDGFDGTYYDPFRAAY